MCEHAPPNASCLKSENLGANRAFLTNTERNRKET